MKFHELLKGFRESRSITQSEMARRFGLDVTTYRNAESGKTSANTPSAKSIMVNDELTKDELQSLKDRAFVGERGVRRVQDIPNFYEELHDLGNLSDVDISHPALQKLRVKVGGKEVYKSGHEKWER